MSEHIYTVYMHISPSNKRYIGVTKQKPISRWRTDGSGYKDNRHFWNAIKKYGWDNFQHKILFENLTKEEAEQKEIELIAYYKSNQPNFGYNVANGGNCKGTVSEETRKKISFANKNRSPETREKLRQAMLGKKLPEETRLKISKSHIGKKFSEDTRNKISKSLSGIKRSDETKRKVSEAKSGKKLTDEHKKKISESNKGRIVTEETRQKLSNAHSGKRLSEETKQKLSEINKGRKGTPLTKEHKELLSYLASHRTKELTEKMANAHKVPIVQLSKDGEFIKRWDSATDVKKEMGINNSNISACCNGRVKSVGGYMWKYESDYNQNNKCCLS